MCFLDFVSNVWDLKIFYSEFQNVNLITAYLYNFEKHNK